MKNYNLEGWEVSEKERERQTDRWRVTYKFSVTKIKENRYTIILTIVIAYIRIKGLFNILLCTFCLFYLL